MRWIPRERAVAQVTALYGDAPCLICALLAGEREAPLVVAESPRTVTILTRFPRAKGHLLVVLRDHLEKVAALSPALWQEASEQARRAACAVEARYRPARVYVASLGSESDAPMTCAHLHLHVIPVMDPDARPAAVLSWQGGVGQAEKAWWQAERAALSALHRQGPA